MKFLKILALVLGSALFIPVSCSSIGIAMLKLEMPLEIVKPNSPYYSWFFSVAMLSNGQVRATMLANLAKAKAETPNYSYLLPKKSRQCEVFFCYQVLADNGTEQIIEVAESSDSLFAIKVWSRYRASHNNFTPISLKTLSMNILFYALAAALFLYGTGKRLRKKFQ